MLATFNEYHWSFLTRGAQISYETNTVGRSVFPIYLVENKLLTNLYTTTSVYLLLS